MLDSRRAGVLLHPTSLPGPAPCGQIGTQAQHFVDFLATSGIGVWQVLPLGPTRADGSPYQTDSTLAIDTKLICAERLGEWGWLTTAEVNAAESQAGEADRMIAQAMGGFQAGASPAERKRYADYSAGTKPWLEDYCLFRVVKAIHDEQPWWQWRQELRNREPAAIRTIYQQFSRELELHRFGQFVAHRQWQTLKGHARARGVALFGDLPIYVAEDSVETWADRSQFQLDDNGRATHVAGVPPDYFSESGQRWGNPLYDWTRMGAENFHWWIDRLSILLERFDLLRIDHFRGFESYWAIPQSQQTAVNGTWHRAPGATLFKTLMARFQHLPLVAEDLGMITPAVHRLRDQFGLPGMRVMQFAFDGKPDNPHLPENFLPNCVAYTGTHDNDTLLGWLATLPRATRHSLQDYLGVANGDDEIGAAMVRTLMASAANLTVLPFQDVLRLGSEHRMNTPGTSRGNWQWRFGWQQIPGNTAERLHTLMTRHGRGLNQPEPEQMEKE